MSKMKKSTTIFIFFLLGIQSIALMAWEIHPTEKVYSIYPNDREIVNQTNVIARFTVSSTVGNLGKGPLIVKFIPNITHGDIARTSDILSIIPNIVALCGRDYPDQPIESFEVEIRFIEDLWNDYREFFLLNSNDAPGKVEFKSDWFQQKSLVFSRSNQKIATIQKAVEENIETLAGSIVVIPEEIHFSPEGIGLSWDSVGNSPGLYIVAPPVISFISKR